MTHNLDIVVGYDGSDTSVDAVRWATGWARLTGRGVTLLTTMSAGGSWSRQQDEVKTRVRERQTELAERLRAESGDVPLTSEFRWGDAAEALASFSNAGHPVAVGNRGLGGIQGVLLGSVSAATVTYSTGPVVVVVPADVKGFVSDAPVVVGFDGSPAALDAAAFAFDFAAAIGQPVRALFTQPVLPLWGPSMMSPLDAGDAVTAAAASAVSAQFATLAGQHPGVRATFETNLGSPAVSLAKASASASLVVVGSRGRGGFTGLLLGSTSRDLLHVASCPVAVVR